jgi:Ca-activated chloride channel family protein
MERLADKGNGNYAYIDNIFEAKKVLVTEFGGTLVALAKDVKIQVEFNPKHVKSYRLIGYENRVLDNEDFNDDKKDAGELGAGHTVTALYEIVPAGSKEVMVDIDPLKYQTTASTENHPEEIMTVKFRYKNPKGVKSKLITHIVKNRITTLKSASENLKFTSAVAQFGLLLRNSEFKGDSSYDSVLALAQAGKGADKEGYRSEFIKIVQMAQDLSN